MLAATLGRFIYRVLLSCSLISQCNVTHRPVISLPLQPLPKLYFEVDLIKAIGLPHLLSREQNTLHASGSATLRGKMLSVGHRASSVSMAPWIYFAVFTRRGQVVKMTGLHPHDPGCHRASAEVSSSKTLSAHQLQAVAPQHSLPFDLILSRKVCSPFWELAGRGVLLIREYKLLCCHCMDITWQSLNSHTPFFFFFLNYFPKGLFFVCSRNQPVRSK